LQIAEMREGIRQDGIDKTWWDCMSFLLELEGQD